MSLFPPLPSGLFKGGPHSRPLGLDAMSEAMSNTTQQVVIHKDDDALARQRLWEHLGCPVAPKHMDEERYKREYRGRHWFCSREVFVQAQSALKIIFCPECRTEADHGAVTASRFFIRVENDVMTVFKAMAQCTCHNCSFEEYYPLTHDPRLKQNVSDIEQELNKHEYKNYMAQNIAAAPGLYGSAGLNALGANMGLAGSGGAGGMARSLTHEMTATEAQALQRLYAQAMQNKVSPPIMAPPDKQKYMDMVNAAPTGMRQKIADQLRKMGLL